MKRLVTSWGIAIKRISNQIILAAGALPIAWLTLPDDWRRAVVEWKDGSLALIATALAIGAFIASNIRQKRLADALEKAYARALDEENTTDS